MNVISYEFGQVLQLIRLDEMRPSSGVYVPDLVRAVRERYRFITGPDPNLTLPSEGLKFETGVIPLDGRLITVKSFGLYNDGVVVGCWNTDDADVVTDDYIRWSTETFHLRPIQTQIRRKHASNVVVDFDVSMDQFLAEFGEIAQAYQSALEAAQGITAETHVHRIAIGPDLAPGQNAARTTLILEQRAATTHSDRRYFSGAPLTSAAHLTLLREIEMIVAHRMDNQPR